MEGVTWPQRIADSFDNVAKQVANTLSTWQGNLFRNSQASFSGMTAKNWIRLVVLVCTYMLIRPHLLKLAERAQMKQFEKEEEKARQEAEAWTKINANSLREGRKGIEATGIDKDEGGGIEGQTGKKTKVRQRKTAKKTVEFQDHKLKYETSDSD